MTESLDLVVRHEFKHPDRATGLGANETNALQLVPNNISQRVCNTRRSTTQATFCGGGAAPGIVGLLVYRESLSHIAKAAA